MNWLNVFILHCIAIVVVANKPATQTDYCKSKLCGINHLACEYTEEFGPDCALNAQFIPMTPKLKDQILRVHNEKRNEIAKGSKILGPAARMAEMVWDDELAFFAKLNVQQCTRAQDMCREAKAFAYPGQNRGEITFVGNTSKPFEYLIFHQIVNWLKDESMAHPSDIRKLSLKNTKKIGSFTVMVVDRNSHIGCAAIHYITAKKNQIIYLTCNYAASNHIGLPTFVESTKAASCCLTGTSSKYPFLCSTNEKFDNSLAYYKSLSHNKKHH